MKKYLVAAVLGLMPVQAKHLNGFGMGFHVGGGRLEVEATNIGALGMGKGHVSATGAFGGMTLSFDHVKGRLFLGIDLDGNIQNTKGEITTQPAAGGAITKNQYKRGSGGGLYFKLGGTCSGTATFLFMGPTVAKLEMKEDGGGKASRKAAITIGAGTKTVLNCKMYMGLQVGTDFYQKVKVKSNSNPNNIVFTGKRPDIAHFRVNVGWIF